jgi:MinD-like ATPase involved in chromosome partitioning or flagellar assembly
MPCEIDQSEGYTRNMIHQLKQHHDSVIVNTLSDLDDCLTLSLLNSGDIKIIVADASPPSILSLEQRVETLRSNGLLKQSDRIIINNCHEGMEKELQQRFQQYNCLFVPYEGAVHSDMMRGVHPDSGEIYEKMKELESSIFGTKMQEKSKRSFSSFFSKVSL